MKKIKVLMVLGNTGRGGAQTFAINVLRMIDRGRFKIDFVANEIIKNGYTQEIYELGSAIYIIPYFKGINWIDYIKEWRRIFKANHYDIVHGHVSSTAVLYLKEAHKYGCKTIAHSHSAGYRGNCFEKLIKKIFTIGAKNQADYWFACSKPAAVRMFGKNYKKNIHYYDIPNAIIAERYIFDYTLREKIRKSLQIKPEQKVYGHVGSFTTPKNHDFLLEVFSKIIEVDYDAILILAGDGERRKEIQLKIDSLGIKDKVILLGNVGNINEYMMAMDTMIFPSFFEGFPVTILEAQATGLPIVLSDTITEEVFLTECVYPLSLDKGVEVWSQKSMEINIKNRIAMNERIAKSKYNMKNCVEELMHIYYRMVEG